MLKRKIEQKLIDWKNTENRKPLIIKGCRQCGKTFSVLDFAKKNYKNVQILRNACDTGNDQIAKKALSQR